MAIPNVGDAAPLGPGESAEDCARAAGKRGVWVIRHFPTLNPQASFGILRNPVNHASAFSSKYTSEAL